MTVSTADVQRPDFQMADYLFAAAEIAPRQPCFVFADGQERSFEETEARVCRLASALVEAGVRKGDRIAMLAVDSAEYIESLIACTLIGAVFTPLNNRLKEDEVRTLLKAADPVVLFTSARYSELAAQVAGDVPALRHTISFDDAGEALPGYEDFLGAGDPTRPDVVTSDDDYACLVFTSGTTGLPKGVLHSYSSFKATMNHAPTNFELGFDGCGYTGSPLFHIAGYGIAFANLVTRNATLVLPQFDPAEVLRCIGRGNVQHCLFVPTMISMLLEHPDCEKTSFDGLTHILYGAAPIAPGLLRRAIDVFGCDFVQLFGAATETGTQLTLTKRDHRRALDGREHILKSVGRPGLSVRMRIVDPDGNAVPVGEVGEIVTRSSQAMVGYLDRPDDTASAIREGWFWGGDLGRQDEDGYVYLAGRRKDMIIRGGENVYPLEIETVLSRVAGIEQIAVIGEADPHWGEIVVACAVVGDAFIGEDAALGECRSKLASYKVPVRIELLDHMPLTGSGKISKPALREAGRAGRASAFGRKNA